MKVYHDLNQKLKDELTNNALINQVTFGDIAEVDLLKQNIFPLAHVTIASGVMDSSTTDVEVSILFLDVVDESNEDETDYYFGTDNEHDIINNMLAAASKTFQEIKRGTLYNQGYQAEETAAIEFFAERFEDKLAGVSITFNVTLQNNIELC